MYENLQKKVVSIAENYADMIDGKIIEAVALKGYIGPDKMLREIVDGIRILHHAVVMLERLARMSRSDGEESTRTDER
ncbi:MAG: hypothetical protein LBK57_03615 [Clostridiales Family XIII bacterium]|jgi:hypothetical protein|nr:hypothetical protein [Clostridiales Family XIII bacterium]